MGYILNIETSTKICSATIAIDGKVVSTKEIKSDQYVHSEKLHTLINDIINKAKLDLSMISAIAICSGPGSYTGLRIGVSTAKGLAYALNIPLISVDSITALFAQYQIENTNSKSIYFPMIDARRKEVYTAGYDNKRHPLFPLGARVIDDAFLSKIEKYDKVYFLGEGSMKFKGQLPNKNISFIDNIHCSSVGMVKTSTIKYQAKDFVDLAYFSPLYLKPFQIH